MTIKDGIVRFFRTAANIGTGIAVNLGSSALDPSNPHYWAATGFISAAAFFLTGQQADAEEQAGAKRKESNRSMEAIESRLKELAKTHSDLRQAVAHLADEKDLRQFIDPHRLQDLINLISQDATRAKDAEARHEELLIYVGEHLNRELERNGQTLGDMLGTLDRLQNTMVQGLALNNQRHDETQAGLRVLVAMIHQAIEHKQPATATDQPPAVDPATKAAAVRVEQSDEASLLERTEAAIVGGSPDALAYLDKLDQLSELANFRRHQLRGDYHYFRGEYDAAIEPYERAMALRPKDFRARNDVATAHAQARLGDIAAHSRRAIEVCEDILALVPPATNDWAMTQNNLAAAWSDMPTGDRAENLRKAIAGYEAALTVRTKQNHPVDWAGTQNNLANTLAELTGMPGEDRCHLLRRAIASGKGALTVHTLEAFPREHQSTAKNLGIDREVYESTDGADQIPFDAIEPAS